MVETELVVKIAAGGAAKTIADVAKLNKAIAQLGKDSKDTNALAKSLGQAFNLPDDQVQDLAKALGQAKNETQALAREARTLGPVFQGIFQGLGQQLTQVGFQAFNKSIAAVKNTVAGSISGFVEFEGALRQAGAISNSLGTPAFAALSDEIVRLGIVTSKTPQEIAATAVSLSRAGFSAEETTVALEGIARASEATGESLETVGDIIAKTIRSFGLAAEESGRVADVLVTGANNANTSVSALGEALKFAAPSAAAANQSLEGTVALLGTLADAGLQGSIGGTGLAGILDRLKTASAGAESELRDLVRGNKRAVQAFDLIAASVRDSEGNMRDLIEVLPEIGANLQGLSKVDQDIVSRALFGVEPGRAFQVIASATERSQDLFNTIRQGEGAAVKTGEKLLQGLAGSVNLIGGSIATLQNQFGEAFAPGLEGAIRLLTDIINQIIEAGDAFTAIEDAGTRFTQVLEANPQIATQLATALNEVAKIISEGIAAQLDNVSNALQSNPQLVQNLANSFVDGAKKVGEFVGALSRIAGALAGIGATAGGIGGSLLSSLVPTFTALVNVLNAAVGAIRPLTNNTALLEAAFQALLIRMVAIRAVALAQSFAGIAAGLISLVQGATAATAATGALSVAQSTGSRSSLLLAQSLAGSAGAAGTAAAGYQAAALSAAGVAAKFALLAAAVAAVSVALTRFKQGGDEFRDAQKAIEAQLVATQAELRKTGLQAIDTGDKLSELLPKEPPPTDFLDGITARLITIQERIQGVIDKVPGLQQALSVLVPLVPGGGAVPLLGALLPDTTNAEKQVNDYKIALGELIDTNNATIASSQEFDGVQSQAAIKVKDLDVAIQSLRASQESLDAGEIGTDAYDQFTSAIDANVEALEREKLEFQRRFGLVDSFSDLVETNQQALEKIQTDATNANARLIEEGAGQREILLAEKKGYEERIAESQRFAAQLKNAIDAEILDPEDVKRANQEIVNAEKAAADTRLSLANVNKEIASLVTSATEEQVASLDSLSTANSTALAQLQIDAANAKAAIIESGGGAAEVAAEEKAALNDRIATNKTFLAQLKTLLAGQEDGSADAIKTAEQIKAVELTLANDRVTLAQETLKAKEEAEKKAADAAKKAAEEKAKAETDALKKQRDEEKRVAEERQADAEKAAQREFDDARDGRSEAREAQRRAEDKALQEELQADDRAFQDERRNSDRAFQKQQQAEAEAFQKLQQAAAEAFQKQLDAERDKGNREFDALGSEVDRRVQLESADPAERKELQQQFEEERKNLELRRQIEKEVLAQRGSVLAQEDLSLSPLEQARADFEAQLQAKAAAFQEGQQLAAQAFQETQAAEAEARAEALRLEDEARAEARAEAEAARAEQRRLEDKAFEESERAIADAFEAQQRQVKAAFNAQQRSLDEASAARIAAILEAAKPAGIDGARRDGGPVRGGGTYLVGEEGPELITPRRGGHVYTAKQTAALMSGTPVRGGAGVTVAQPSTGAVEAKLDRLIAVVEKGRSVQAGGNTYNLNTDNPIQDSVSIELERIRGMVRGGGL